MANIEDGKVGIVITKDLSRLGRDYLKTGELIEMIFPDYYVRYIAINDGVDTSKSENEFLAFKNIFNDIFLILKKGVYKMKLTNNYSYRPNEERLSKIEKTWDVKLPKEIRKSLMNYNGGVPEKRNFQCGKRIRMIERFLCIKEKNTDEKYACYDINVVLTQVEERIVSDPELIGYEIIPVAELFAGDLLCLDYRESDTPAVCIWFHEESEEWNPVTEKVADNFSEFMYMLLE